VGLARCRHVMHMTCMTSISEDVRTGNKCPCPKGCQHSIEEMEKEPACVAHWHWSIPAPGEVLIPEEAPPLLFPFIEPFRPKEHRLPLNVKTGPPVAIVTEKVEHAKWIDQAFFRGPFEAGFIRCNDMSFSRFVSDCNSMPRADILRYLFLADRDSLVANQSWTLMAARRAWVSVPSQYKCDRTFLRNVYEAIWLPIADFYLKCETEGDYRSSYARLLHATIYGSLHIS